MRIISRGIPKSELPFRITCKACETVFEFTEAEAEVKDGGTFRDDNKYFWRVACPVCRTNCFAYETNRVARATTGIQTYDR